MGAAQRQWEKLLKREEEKREEERRVKREEVKAQLKKLGLLKKK